MNRDQQFNKVVNGGFQLSDVVESDQFDSKMDLDNELAEDEISQNEDPLLEKLARDYSEEELASAGIKSKLFRISGY